MKNEGVKMEKMEKAMRMLRLVQSDLDMAHIQACAALGAFKAIDADKSLEPDVRLAAVSLRNEALVLCGKIVEATNAIPEAAMPKAGRAEIHIRNNNLLPKPVKKTDRVCNRGIVARSARYGRPIVAAMTALMICAIPMTGNCSDQSPIANRQSAVIDRVIDALVQIESSGRPAVTGDNGSAVGLLQLHPVAVREANRIAGENRWKLSDRLCPTQSRAMARTILTWHYRRGVTDPVDLACRWNKPFGQTTAHYRAKVRAALGTI